MNVNEIIGIDVHSHFTVNGKGGDMNRVDRSLDFLLEMQKAAKIGVSFCTNYEAVEEGKPCDETNAETIKAANENESIYSWVVVDPRDESTFVKASEFLKMPKAVGIKPLPITHGYDFKEYADKVLGFAREVGAITHVQLEGDVAFLGDIAKANSKNIIILGALNRYGYIDALKKATDGNLFVDTAGGALSSNLLLEKAVKDLGPDNILLGTEGTTSLAYMRGRIEYSFISDEDKVKILRDNALRLFKDFLEVK